MDIHDWATRWKEGRIGFHEGQTNKFLAKHVGRLGSRRRVLVPLCGKAEDLAFLASRGHEVVGIEAVETAVEAFFREHGLEPIVRAEKPIRSYSAAGITILAGDVFACTSDDVGRVDALYDRAALVALEPAERPSYAAHLRSLLVPHAPGLIVTFEYPQERMAGPPFSVGLDDVIALFPGTKVESIDEGPVERACFREAGVTASERCLAVTL